MRDCIYMKTKKKGQELGPAFLSFLFVSPDQVLCVSCDIQRADPLWLRQDVPAYDQTGSKRESQAKY